MRVELERDRSLCTVLRRLAVAWESPVVSFLVRMGASSRPPQLHALRRACRAFGAELAGVVWEQIDRQQFAALRSWLNDHHAPGTGNSTLSAVRGVLLECVRGGTLSRDAYERIIDVKPIRGSRELRGRAVPTNELEALFVAARKIRGPIGLRHAAMLGVMYGGGLRRAEVCRLELDEYTVELVEVDDAKVESGTLRTIGKGNVERMVPLPAGATAAIGAWLRARGLVPGPLFCHVRKLTVNPLRRLDPASVYRSLEVIQARAKVKRLSPHDLRRTFCSDLLDAGADLRTVQELMGHADPITTARYDKRGERSRRRAVQLIKVPA
ncbi:MAG: tyrosine-type recombinase/integrase [Polyangiaceae bacterium]|nr:tyrosine-type recombinase/integrase [Polyangiaceae bacterium]